MGAELAELKKIAERYEQAERERGKLKQGERESLASAKSGGGVITTHEGYTRGLNS